MDASIAIKPVFDRFQSVVITSGVSYYIQFMYSVLYYYVDCCSSPLSLMAHAWDVLMHLVSFLLML